MYKGIPISKKYGVNPTMGVCFWCGQHTGEIALLGELPNDAEAPRETVLNYEPCKECKQQFDEGVLIIEVETGLKYPPIQANYSPTGRHVVLKEQAFTNQQYKKGDKCLMTHDEFEHMFGSIIK